MLLDIGTPLVALVFKLKTNSENAIVAIQLVQSICSVVIIFTAVFRTQVTVFCETVFAFCFMCKQKVQ